MPPGRRRYENQCKDPPTEAKQDQIPRASAALGMTALKTKGTERFFVRPGPTQNDNGSDGDGSTGRSACATEAAWKAALQKRQGPATFL